MELLQLEYFCRLAQSEHLTRTAGELRISPPALSHTIRQLEKDLGAPLFDRVGRRMRLNRCGKVFYRAAALALEELERGKRAVGELQCQETSIYIVLTHSSLWGGPLISYQNAHPELHLHVQILGMNRMLAQGGQPFDFYLGNKDDIAGLGMRFLPLLNEEPPCLAMNVRHPLAGEKSLDLRDLGEETFFSLRQYSHSAATWQNTLFQLAGLEDPILVEGDVVSRIKALQANCCVALTTTLGFRNNFFGDPQITAVPLSYPIVTRQQVVAWNEAKEMGVPQRDFLAYVTGLFGAGSQQPQNAPTA